jgi:hypothetical protein
MSPGWRGRRELGLTALPLVGRHTIDALREFPYLNATLEGTRFTRYDTREGVTTAGPIEIRAVLAATILVVPAKCAQGDSEMRSGRFELPRPVKVTRPSTLRADCPIRPDAVDRHI